MQGSLRHNHSVWLLYALFLIAWLGYATSVSRLEKIHRPDVVHEMHVALPLFMQVLMSGGDRFLASNISVFRALIVNTENQDPSRFITQGRVQQDAAWLNPAHEDNYYLAAAALAWNGQLGASQEILNQANDARPYDMLPPFFMAFNEYHFRDNPVSGAEWLKVAAIHATSEADRLALHRLAAYWTMKGKDRLQAIKILEMMAAQSRYSSLKHQINMRADQVRNLAMLDEKIQAYEVKHHRHPSDIQTLIQDGFLKSIPSDPLNMVYFIDEEGIAQVTRPEKR